MFTSSGTFFALLLHCKFMRHTCLAFPPFLPPVAVVIGDDQVGADAPAPSALSVMTLMTTGAMGE